MQTFLPYQSFAESARVLDRQRLGKQRVENLQIMKALSVKSGGWQNHPATKMWRGYEFQFLLYQVDVVREWEARGYADTCLAKTVDIYQQAGFVVNPGFPPWLGNERIHISHQSNLIRKDPDHYGPFFPGVPNDLEYYWPI